MGRNSISSWFRRILWGALGSLLLLGVAYITLDWLANAPGRAIRALQKSLHAEYQDHVQLFFEVNQLSPHSDFVVASLEETVSGAYISDKSWVGLDLGTTSLDYRLPVKYLYAIDFSGERPIRFDTDAESRTLSAEFPPVELLAVETDLGRLEKDLSIGWARLRTHSGKELQQRFRDNIMSDLRAKGSHPRSLYLVQETARRQLAGFMYNYLLQGSHFGDEGIEQLVIRFAGEEDDAPIPVFRADTLRDIQPRDTRLEIRHE